MVPKDFIFGHGVPLLVKAGSSDKDARSLLGLLCKTHGDRGALDLLRECIAADPLQPLTWLQKASVGNGRRRTPPRDNFAAVDYGEGISNL